MYFTPPRARARDPRRADALDAWGRGAAERVLTVRCPRGHALVWVWRTPALLAVWNPPRGRARAAQVSRSAHALLLTHIGAHTAAAQCFRCDRPYPFDPAALSAAVKAGKRVFVIRPE